MAAKPATRVPSIVPFFNPLARRLLGRGVPLGPNALLTVRGRKSGVDRTTPVAVVELQGRRWVIGTFGDVNWVRNLRAAREARLAIGSKVAPFTADELTPEEATRFFSQVLGPYVRGMALGPLLLRLLNARDVLSDPAAAAATRPMFELHQAA